MDSVYKKFYRNFYIRTNGFMPTKPLNQNIYPGDFFQIKNGEMIVLGNIFRNKLISPEEFELAYGIHLNPVHWHFSEGVTKPYSGRDVGHNPIEGDFEFSKQMLAFDSAGSFFFRGNHPQSAKIMNWNDLQQELIIKLTQTYYSFRELYVVTESAITSDWTLVLAGSDKAELEIATESENSGLVDLFGEEVVKTMQARDIEFYHREFKKKPSFFKAKKLVVQEQKLDTFISNLISERANTNAWVNDFYDFDFDHDPINFTTPISNNAQACILDMLQANELNPNTALLYFRWADASLDDIEKFFTVYGN